VAANFHAIITSVYLSSDAALATVLGEAAGHVPAGSFISLGNHAWYEEWLFLSATRGLPGHRSLWEVAPALWSLLGLGVLMWSAWRALDGRSAALCGAALLCVGAFGRFCFLAVNWHSLALVHTILILAVFVWLLPRLSSLGWAPLLALAAGLGALSALPLASDSLFPFWAMAPLIGSSALLLRALHPRERGRLIIFTATLTGVAVIGALALARTMRSAGITSRALPVHLAGLSTIASNIPLMARSYAFLAGGRLDADGGLALASAVLVLLALVLVLDQLRRLALARGGREPMSPVRHFYVSFWAISLLATTAVYLLTDAPKDALSGRYLLAGYAAIAALLPLVAARSRVTRRLLTAGVCAFALIATYQVLDRPFDVVVSPEVSIRFPGPATASALERFARAERVARGYGGYWDAEELTWAMNFALPVRPVRVCSSRSYSLCYPQLGMISSWYEPVPGARSLLIVDSVGTSFNGILAPDPALGRPLAERRLGLITAYVYPFDIASWLRRPSCGFTWAHPC
jgi:hypothetical protein